MAASARRPTFPPRRYGAVISPRPRRKPAQRRASVDLVDQNRIEPEGGARPRRLLLARNIRKCLAVARRDGALLLDMTIHSLELGAAERRLEICKAVVVPDLVVDAFEPIVLGLRPEIVGAIHHRLIIGDDHPTAAGGDELVAV